MFNHPEVTRTLLEWNKGDVSKQQLCKEIARPGYEVLDALPSPRFIKSHFPLSLLPNILDSGCKVNYYKISYYISSELFLNNFSCLFLDSLRSKKSKRRCSFMVYSE